MIYSIGHSDHSIEGLLRLLCLHGIEAIADVRSNPHSRRFPQFDHKAFAQALNEAGIAYVPLGDALGGRPSAIMRRELRGTGYEAMARTANFKAGLDRLLAGSGRYAIAMVCAERDPADCHRALLVGRALHDAGMPVTHILADGATEPHLALESRLLEEVGLGQSDLFSSPIERVALAYRTREDRLRATIRPHPLGSAAPEN